LAAYGYVRKISMLPVPFVKVHVVRSALLDVVIMDNIDLDESQKPRITCVELKLTSKVEASMELTGVSWLWQVL
jgi:hypothetical protein